MSTAPFKDDLPTAAANDSAGVRVAFDAPPELGSSLEVAPGVWWIRLPLSSNVGHVNVFLLEDELGWTLVDTGTNAATCRDALLDTLAKAPFAGRPVKRILATHFHPDHIGLAGEIAKQGATLWTTRSTWLLARMFQLDDRPAPLPEHLTFAERAGLKGNSLAYYCRRPGSEYRQLVSPLPTTYVRLCDADILTIGTRQWKVIVGHGHAAEHATFWSDDGLAICGDQILLGLASNLSVHPSEPEADLVSEWVESCTRMMSSANDKIICLPGHNLPFSGIATRCQQMLATQEAVLNRLLVCLTRPRTAADCLAIVYRRQLQSHEMGPLVAETIGFLHYLTKRGLVHRELAPDNSYLWQRKRDVDQQFQLSLTESGENDQCEKRPHYPR